MVEGVYNLVMSLKTEQNGTAFGNKFTINLTVENTFDASIIGGGQNSIINVKPGETTYYA